MLDLVGILNEGTVERASRGEDKGKPIRNVVSSSDHPQPQNPQARPPDTRRTAGPEATFSGGRCRPLRPGATGRGTWQVGKTLQVRRGPTTSSSPRSSSPAREIHLVAPQASRRLLCLRNPSSSAIANAAAVENHILGRGRRHRSGGGKAPWVEGPSPTDHRSLCWDQRGSNLRTHRHFQALTRLPANDRWTARARYARPRRDFYRRSGA